MSVLNGRIRQVRYTDVWNSIESNFQVSVMQVELTELQPQLIKTSEETDKIMVKIEHDSVEVEAKKEVGVVYSSLPQ